MGWNSEDKRRPLGDGAGWEEGKTMIADKPGSDRAMSEGKLMPAVLMKEARERRREGEDQTGASGGTDGTP